MYIDMHHIGLLTTEIDKSIHFYTHLLGMQILSRSSNSVHPETVWLDDGSKSTKLLLSLIGPPFSSWMEAFIATHGPMLACLGFEVDEIDMWYDYCLTEKIEVITPIEEIEGGRQFYVRDPVGITLRLIQHTPSSSTSTDSVTANKASNTYKMSHTNITCKEIRPLKDFYVGKLGMKIVLDKRDEGMIFLATQEALSNADHDIFPLELFGPPGLWEPDEKFLRNHGAGLQYLCFAAVDVDVAYQELNSAGVDFHLKPTNIENNRVAFFKDPNGIDIEILHPLPQSMLRGISNA